MVRFPIQQKQHLCNGLTNSTGWIDQNISDQLSD